MFEISFEIPIRICQKDIVNYGSITIYQYNNPRILSKLTQKTCTKNKNCYTILGNVNWCCISTTKRNYYCAVQHTIASNALTKRTLERTDIKNSATLLSFRILTTICNFKNWTIMANFGNNSTTISDFRNSRTVYDFSNSTVILDISNWTTTSAFRNSNDNIWLQE